MRVWTARGNNILPKEGLVSIQTSFFRFFAFQLLFRRNFLVSGKK